MQFMLIIYFYITWKTTTFFLTNSHVQTTNFTKSIHVALNIIFDRLSCRLCLISHSRLLFIKYLLILWVSTYHIIVISLLYRHMYNSGFLYPHWYGTLYFIFIVLARDYYHSFILIFFSWVEMMPLYCLTLSNHLVFLRSRLSFTVILPCTMIRSISYLLHLGVCLKYFNSLCVTMLLINFLDPAFSSTLYLISSRLEDPHSIASSLSHCFLFRVVLLHHIIGSSKDSILSFSVKCSDWVIYWLVGFS